MSQDNDENIDSTNDDGQDPVADPDSTDDIPSADEGVETDSIDELKEKLQRSNKQNAKLFERAKRAEGFKKEGDKWVKEEKPKPQPVQKETQAEDDAKHSLLDTVALIEAKVTSKEDLEVVTDYAKLKKISLAEALKSPIVKATLEDRKEERTTANATNTAKSRSGHTTPSGDSLFKKAVETGQLPDRDEDLDKMLESRYQPKSKN